MKNKTEIMKYGIGYSVRRLWPVLMSFFIATSLTLTSCGADYFDQPSVANTGGGETFMTFSLALPSNSIPSTRALSTNDEDAVENIQILAFQNNKYIYTAYCNSIVNNRFTVSLRTGAYDLVVLANSLDAVSGLSLVSGTTNQSDVLDALVKSTTAGTGWISNPSDADYQKIPMSSGVLTKTIDEGSTGTTTILLYRMLAKINVEIMPTAQAAFKLESVRLYNYNTNGRVYPYISGGSVDMDRLNLPVDPGKITGDTDPALRYTEITGGISCKETIYTFEAANGGAFTFSTNPCIVIGGSYNGGATTYYRVDFSTTAGVYLDLLRNHRYEVKIKAVNSPGLPDENTAFESRPVDVVTEIVVWDEKTLPDISYEQYTLTIGENNVILTKEKTRSGITITSTYEKNPRWTAEVTYPDAGNAGWLSISPGSSSEETSIMLYTADENTGTTSRTATITVTSGKIVKPITITQSAYANTLTASSASNCYMIQPGGYAVKIPVSRANASVSGSVVSNDILEGDLLWTDCSKGLSINSAIHRILRSGTGDGGHLIVIPGTAEGNAVITLKTNSNQTIKWSWHIWVTGYNLPLPAASGTFMDRNLGAMSNSRGLLSSMGFLYQWGRKDPFPGSAALAAGIEPTIYNASGKAFTITKANVAVANNLANAVANPGTYYIKTTSPNDWYTNGTTTSSQNNNLWGSSKTVYDPCPAGWKVPAVSVWNSLTENNFPWSNYGRTYASVGGWYPAAGSRDYSRDMFYGVGEYGYYWTATVSGDSGCDLYFDKYYVYLTSTAQRASGFPIRCVAE